jgi:solute carrier family 35 (GDP-fucose transporter), member C1
MLCSQACAQTILALSIAGEGRSSMWWFSNALVLGGSMGYTHFRRLEMIEQSKQAPKA